MSQENVEVVQAGFEAWNAGDMEAFGGLFADDAIIVRFLEGWPEPGPFVGRETIMRTFEQLRETWDADTLEIIGGPGRPRAHEVPLARSWPRTGTETGGNDSLHLP